jgi:hypothetical protein
MSESPTGLTSLTLAVSKLSQSTRSVRDAGVPLVGFCYYSLRS